MREVENTSKTYGRVILVVVLGILSTIFVINAREAISLMNMNIRNFTDREVFVARERRPDVYKRVFLAALNIVVAVISSMTRVLPFLEKKVSEIVGNLRRRFKISYGLQLEGVVFVSAVMVVLSLVQTSIAYYPAGIVVRRIIAPKPILLLSPLVIYPLFSFITLNLLGDSPTYGKLVRMVGRAVLPTVRTMDTMAYFIIRMVSFIIFLATMFVGMYNYVSTYSLRINMVPGTEKFYSMVQELASVVGKRRAFNNVYITSVDVLSPALAIGIFWDQDIYVSLPGLNLFNLDLKELFGVLVHEAGHCYYRHNTIVTFAGIFSILLLIAAGGWLVIESRFADELVGSLLPDNSGNKETVRPSTAMKLLAFLLVICPAFTTLSALGLNLLGRYNEFQADSFAVSTGNGEELLGFLVKLLDLSIESKSRIYSALYEVHPFASDRIMKVKKAMESLKATSM